MRTFRSALDSSAAVRCFWRGPNPTAGYRTAVSLHSHTFHSREGLSFVPRVLRKVGPAQAILNRVEKHYCEPGHKIPFERAFWRPPLHSRAAYTLECGQIRNLLNLQPLVSITDHDNISACSDLQTLGEPVPYSSEWSVPFHGTEFHVGVHNLPAASAAGLAREMARYTASPTPQLLSDLLTALHEIDPVLLVLNHPYCNEGRGDRASHVALLHEFLDLYGDRLHALELNGLQPASDNRLVIGLAAERNLPVISGGDRHCTEPNANVNLTNAATFDEFVAEVKCDRHSQVLFLPQYRESIPSRYIQFISQAVACHPSQAGHERWTDRVFFESGAGETLPLSQIWQDGNPRFIDCFVSAVGLLAAKPMRAALQLAFGQQGEIGA